MSKILHYFTTPQFWISLIVIAASLTIHKVVGRLLDRREQHAVEQHRNISILHLLHSLGKVILLLFMVITVLQINGINVGALVASLGLLGATVGLALQSVLENVIEGAHLAGDRFFAVGDVVRYGDAEARVLELRPQSIRLENIVNGEVTTVSNRCVSQITVLPDYFDLEVPLSYADDPEHIHAALREIAARIAKAEKVTDCRYFGTWRFDDSSVCYRLRVYGPAAERFAQRLAAMDLLQRGLAEAGLEVPFNQLDVHTFPN